VARQINRLSAVEVRNFKAKGMLADGGGLFLQVSEAGTKSWVFRYRRKGKRRDMGLGAAQRVKLSEARAHAAECRRLLLQGEDPITARRRVVTPVSVDEVTFRDAFETFYAVRCQTLSNAKHRAQWRSTIETYAFPMIGHRPVADVQTGEILDVLTPIWFAKPETGKRLLQRLEAVFKSAILRGHRERASPCIGVAQELGTRHRAVRNHRSLPYEEVGTFLASLRASNSQLATRLALEWLILTATRSSETRLAQWHEIDESRATWTIPPERMKARRPHLVPLPTRCLQILREARSAFSGSGLIFPGTKVGAPLSDMTFTKVLRDLDFADRATAHGFRSSFKTWCAEVARARDDVSEACLAHQVRDRVKAAYLHTDFLMERRSLMAMWAQHCLASKVHVSTLDFCGEDRAVRVAHSIPPLR
jgi:integrase